MVAFRILAAIGIVSSHCLIFQSPASFAGVELRTLLYLRDFGLAGFFMIGGVLLARADFDFSYVRRRWVKVLPPTLAAEFTFAVLMVGTGWMTFGSANWIPAYWLWFIYFYLGIMTLLSVMHRAFGMAAIHGVFIVSAAIAIALTALQTEPDIVVLRTLQATVQVSAGAIIGMKGLSWLHHAPGWVALAGAAAIVAMRVGVEELPVAILHQALYAAAIFAALPRTLVSWLGRIDFQRISPVMFGTFLVHGFVVSGTSAVVEFALWGRIMAGKVTPAYALFDTLTLWLATTTFVFLTSMGIVVFGLRIIPRTLASFKRQ
jgi:hypothetical protein